VSGQSFDDAVDAAIEGQIDTFDTVFTRQCQAGNHPFQALGSAMRLFQSLHSMRGAMDGGGGNAASVVGAHRPPIFYARRKLVERALQRWSAGALNRGLARLQTAVLETRRRPDLAVALARQALLGIAVEGARLGRNINFRR
jgi:DNA polymerase-3 subunit delta